MAGASQIYHDSFAHARPSPSFAAVSDRLALTKAYTTDLSHYFRERAQLEDAYVKSLQKLHSRLHQGVMPCVDGLGLERRDEERQLGAWKGVRDRLETEVGETAGVHERWRKKVLDEVEGPLRFSLTKPDWLRYSQDESSLAGLVRDYDSTLDKINKANSKGKGSKSTTSKVLSAQSHLSSLGSSLSSSLPPFLSAAQAVDDSHAAFLTEALVRYGTLESDLGRERMEAGERFLNAVLAVDRETELQGWALRESMRAGGQSEGRRGDPNPGDAGGKMTELGAPHSGRATSLASPSIPEESLADTLRAPVQADRQRTPSLSRSAPAPATLALPTAVPESSSSTSAPSKPSKFIASIFKRDRAGSGSAAKAYGSLDVPSPSSGANFDRQSFESRDSGDTGPEEATSTAFARTSAPSLQPAAAAKKRESMMPSFGGGGSLFRRPSRANSHQSVTGPTPPSPMMEMRENDGGLAPPSPRVVQPQLASSGGAIDDEGYSLPPAGYDKQPWEAAIASESSGNIMDEDEDETGAPSHLGARLPSVAIAPTTITETESDRQAALERVKSTLLSAKALASPLGLGGPTPTGVTRRTTGRGRRDVRMTTYNPSLGDDVPLAKIIEQQRAREESNASHSNSVPEPPSRSSTIAFAPFTASPSGTILSMSAGGNDRANSILSTASSTTGSHRPDPFAHSTGPGLRASITETVNVLLKGGEVTRVMVAGELSLSHRPSPFASTGPLKIRIARFEQFEKAAPNAAFLTPVPDQPGEYILSPALAAANGTTHTVLKYQLHVPKGQERSFVPLLVRASWKCDPGLSRVIVHYEPNPTAKLAAATASSPFGEDEQAPLEDLRFVVPISCPIVSYQAKPTATWSPDKARLAFNVPGTLPFDALEAKLLASVTTEGSAVPQPIIAMWKLVGRSVSEVGVELASGGEEIEDVVRTTVAGKYLVAP